MKKLILKSTLLLLLIGITLFGIVQIGYAENRSIDPTAGCVYIRSFVSEAGSGTKYIEYNCGYKTVYVLE